MTHSLSFRLWVLIIQHVYDPIADDCSYAERRLLMLS